MFLTSSKMLLYLFDLSSQKEFTMNNFKYCKTSFCWLECLGCKVSYISRRKKRLQNSLAELKYAIYRQY